MGQHRVNGALEQLILLAPLYLDPVERCLVQFLFQRNTPRFLKPLGPCFFSAL